MNFTLPYDHYLSIYRYKYLALYHALRTAILEGKLPGGTRLPSTRHLAELYVMSRGSVSQVYDMLLADGYIKTETGRGTFVSDGSFPPDAGSAAEGGVQTPPADAGAVSAADASDRSSPGTGEHQASPRPVIPLSAWGERLMNRQISVYKDAGEGSISFQSSAMPMEHFPYSEWRSALNYAGGKGGGRMESFCPPQGDESLRRAIAAHLGITRGIRADAGQIVLFSGSMQGIVLLTQLLLEPGSAAVVEEPGFHGIRRAVEISGGHLLPGRVDESGLVPEDWDARLLFVTPSRQFPTGAVLPLDRRRSLLEWAKRHEAVIIEDDYDSEFRWTGRPIEPLKALDREERVVYIGSFSNSMFSGLRLGYAVLPPALTAPVTAAKALYEPLPGGQLEQRALARFMNTGEYSRHLRRMTRIYGERARFFRSLLSEQLGMLFEPHPGDSGLHIYARWLRSAEEFAAFQAAAALRSTGFRDARLYRMSPGAPAACFYFSHLNETELEEGIFRLRSAWEDVQNMR
ncbi:PLP-dependent aminotransferase family protein [Paenibacillus sp. PK3_47]|uniref:MocR-like pyridoxine biosynthesis transcription factor PdxR n=1 Tax=Paenibacillus sp. PK3_47 TaxID=2072642 RepID=UPI00201D7A17|nr:PLP-dependent aminotransferase family protein [Paenibacillus sp. PK3_47]UQZ33255.1 PLP-dependent aminotransferase family protein [Paenibacillus sp. PK3_47]